MAPADYIPYRQIAQATGIREGEMVMVASGLTMIALSAKRREGGFSVDALLDSFLAQLGEGGTLIIPAYNHKLRQRDSFDIRRSKPLTGTMAEVALARNDFIRTRHPMHSCLVWGKHAGALAEMQNKSSFGPDSPFAFMLRHDAHMLILGTTVSEAFTFTHFVEEQEKVPYRKYKKYLISYTGISGETTTEEFTLFHKKQGWTMSMDSLEKALVNITLQKGRINGVSYSMVSLKKAYDIILDDIRNNNAASIARFDTSLFIKENLKKIFNLFSYRTTSDKINHDTGL